MAVVTSRISPNSPFSVVPRPEIPRSPYRGAGVRGRGSEMPHLWGTQASNTVWGHS